MNKNLLKFFVFWRHFSRITKKRQKNSWNALNLCVIFVHMNKCPIRTSAALGVHFANFYSKCIVKVCLQKQNSKISQSSFTQSSVYIWCKADSGSDSSSSSWFHQRFAFILYCCVFDISLSIIISIKLKSTKKFVERERAKRSAKKRKRVRERERVPCICTH